MDVAVLFLWWLALRLLHYSPNALVGHPHVAIGAPFTQRETPQGWGHLLLLLSFEAILTEDQGAFCFISCGQAYGVDVVSLVKVYCR